MGWLDVAVLAAGPVDGDWEAGPHTPRVLDLAAASAPQIDAMGLQDRLAAGKVTVIDFNLSTRYRLGHIPSAWFAIRSRLGATLASLPSDQAVVLTSPVELAPMQFIDELVCEMTSLEFGTPGIRPRST